MKKYLLTIFFVLLFGASQIFSMTGTGPASDPYVIENEGDLLTIMNPANSATYWATGVYIELGRDLDMSTVTGEIPIGTSYSNTYQGNFDGKGHVIRNLDIDLSTTDYVGLFGYTYGATISNLGVEDASIKGDNQVGIFCGNNNVSTISDCYATGSVTGSGNNVGGFCGLNYFTISNCYATGNATGSSSVGAFCGCNNGGSISNCYSTGNASGSSIVGGFCGRNISTISYCYSIGEPTCTGSNCNEGGFVGKAGGTYTCCYWGFEGASLDDTGNNGNLDDQYSKSLLLPNLPTNQYLKLAVSTLPEAHG